MYRNLIKLTLKISAKISFTNNFYQFPSLISKLKFSIKKIVTRLITLSGILRDGILLLVRKCRLISTRYQDKETKNNISKKFNYSSPRATFIENKGKKENISFLRDSERNEEIIRIKRKRDENYDVKNGTQRMRKENGFSDSHFHENQNHENKYLNQDVKINKRTYHDNDDDEGEDDDENEYLNQLSVKKTHIGRNNISQNIIKKPEINKNKNWEESDDDDDDFNNDRGRINNNHHRVQLKTVGGRDSSKQYDNLNQKGNASVNSRGDKERAHREKYGQISSSSSSSMRRENREEGVQGRGQEQGEGEEEEEREEEEESVESVMVWAMALVGKRERASPVYRYTAPHSNIHHHTACSIICTITPHMTHTHNKNPQRT